MKKLTAIIIAFLSFTFCATAQKRLISASLGFSTGIPLYSDDEISKLKEAANAEKRFVIGSYANLNINIVEQASVFLGAEVFSDFNWNGSFYANHLHTEFPLGIKLSPDLGGFAFGTAYILGFRADFYNTEDDGKANSTSAWGNGFQLFAEYDFSYHIKFMPTVGVSWTIMPRGNYTYDNLLRLYLGINF